MNKNSFVEVMKSRSDIELIEILSKRNDYQTEAVLAAESEITLRNLTSNEIRKLENLLAKKSEEEKNTTNFHDLIDKLNTDFQPSRVNAFAKEGFTKKKKKAKVQPLEENWKVLLVLFPFIFGKNAIFNSVAYKDDRSNEIVKYKFYGVLLYAILFVILLLVIILKNINDY